MISAIVCADLNNAIGYKGELLERIPEDMECFKKLTTDKLIIMGRKTWDSLPVKPLPNRFNWVITSNSHEAIYKNNSYFESDLISAIINLSLIKREQDIFIIGGGQIYEQLLPYCDCVYLTRILHKYPNADTYFPDIESMPEWERISCSEVKQWCDIQYQFELYGRIEGDSNG